MPRYHEGIVDAEEIRKPNAFKNSKIRSQESRQLCKEELDKVVGAGDGRGQIEPPTGGPNYVANQGPQEPQTP